MSRIRVVTTRDVLIIQGLDVVVVFSSPPLLSVALPQTGHCIGDLQEAVAQ